MVPQKQTAIIQDITKCLNELLLFGVDCSMNIDSKDARLPVQDFETPLINFMSSLVRSYKYDFDGLYRAYRTSDLWKKAIRSAFLMDDEDEKGYWFYHIYGSKPNKLLWIYIEEHFPIALEKILEMFELGYRSEFLKINPSVKDLTGLPLFDHGIDEMLNIIDERIRGNRLSDVKATAKFLSWLYTIDKKKLEKIISLYEVVGKEPYNEIAKLCRDTLQHEAPEQLSLLEVA